MLEFESVATKLIDHSWRAKEKAAMSFAREDVLAAVKQWFPAEDTASVMSVLDAYGTETYERERERVQIAILKLSQGDADKLLHNVQAAKQDYRDVLYWAEYGIDKK
jgi:hypothetical protein